MTQREFDQLPLLLTRSQFRQITGLTSCDITNLVRGGQVSPMQLPAGGGRTGTRQRARYRKVDVARIAGLKV